MAYEYGCIVGMGDHEICATEETLPDAMAACEALQLDWDGTSVRGWSFTNGEYRGISDDPDEPWYVRRV